LLLIPCCGWENGRNNPARTVPVRKDLAMERVRSGFPFWFRKL